MEFRRVLLAAGVASAFVGTATAQAVSPPANQSQRYLIHIEGGGLGITTDDTIRISKSGYRWILERLVKDHNWCGGLSAGPHTPCTTTEVIKHQWADSSTCRAIAAAMVGVDDVWRMDEATAHEEAMPPSEMPQFSITEHDNDAGHQRAISEMLGPLASWWSTSASSIKACWSDAAPVDDGEPLHSQLAPTWDDKRKL